VANEIAIKVSNVSKTFKLPHEKTTSIKGAIINFYRHNRTYEKLEALKDVSFEVKKGEFFGIVGKNGSGKSTMLKLLAGIYSPSEGSVVVNGKLTPFIELGVGFSPELSGRENVFLNGALLGFSRSQMQGMYDDIVSFAELEKFMDQKLKNYSSGMQVRLAFSIAIRAESDILLIDEVLAVGDISFQQKCYDYFDKLKEEKRTIVLVTHDMSAVKQFCDRALFINQGVAKNIGDPEEISQMYEKINYADSDEAADTNDEKVNLKTVDKNGSTKQKFEYGEDLQFDLSWPLEEKVGIAGVVIYKGTEVVFATNTVGQSCNLKDGKVSLKVNGLIGAGRYKATATIFGSNRKIIITTSKMQTFLVYNQPLKGDHDDEWEGTNYLKSGWL
jgi:ABC-2 type transport system ATP-binding protein